MGDAFVVLAPKEGEWRSVETWYWADRAEQFPTETVVRRFLDGAKWRLRDFTRAPEREQGRARTTVSIESSSENYEFRDEAARHVLYAFAYDHTVQRHFALDLGDESSDPTVYEVDHDGSSYAENDSLSAFFATLERA